jgi:CRP-like cAMP-binding protein
MNVGDYELFSGFSALELKELELISFEKNYSAGEIIFMEGESSKYMHILLDGRVDIVKANAKFGEFFLHSLNAPSMVAELATFEQMPFPATARAAVDVKLLKIDFDIFKNKLLSRPTVSYQFIKSLLHKMKILEGFIQKELNLGAEEKIITLLGENPSVFDEKKHLEIAKILNITPETLSRTLRKLKDQGIIELDGKKVKFLNLQ